MKEVALTREVENSKLKGWIWEKYKDGSGGLIDNNGNTFLIYDLFTDPEASLWDCLDEIESDRLDDTRRRWRDKVSRDGLSLNKRGYESRYV